MATSKRLNSGDVRRLKRSLDITAFYDLPLDDGQIVVSAGSTSNSVSELVFSDGGNISFGLNGSTLTATVAGGPPGPPGPPGPSVTIFDYRADTSIAVGYPGDGHIRWDNATQINSGTLRISHLTDGNVDIDRILSLLVAGQDLILQDANASANYQEWKVSGAPTNFNPGAANSYWDIPVTLITSAGTGTTNFPNNHQIILEIIRVGPPGPAGSITVSAGTLSSQASHLTFQNSNGVSWGFDGANITATVATNYQSQGAYLTTAMASNRGPDFVQANATFHGTNASGTIASDGLSVSVAAPSAASINISAGSTSSNVSAITFSNGSGVSFGFDGTNITATVATNYQTSGAYLTTAALSQDSSKYAGTNGSVETTSGTDLALTLNTSGATIAYPKWLTTAMASNAATISNINVSAGTTSNNLSAIKFADTIGLSFGLSGSTITGAPAIGVSAGTLAATLGGYTFSNSNNVSFGQAAGGTITATVASSLTNIKISAGASSGNVSALTFSNGSGVSFGFDGSNITATVATNYQSQGAYLTTAALSGQTSNFAGTNTSLQTTSGTDLKVTLNTTGLTIAYPAWITTAGAASGVQSLNGSQGQLTIVASGLNSVSNNASSIVVSARSESLNEIQNPAADAVFSMGGNACFFSYNQGGSFSTNATREGMFQISVAGNVTQEADVFRLWQGGGAPSTLDMLHIEAGGTNVTALRLQNSCSVAGEFNNPIKFTTADTNFSIGSVPMILGTGMSNVVANLNANYLQGSQASQFAASNVTSARAGTNTSVATTGGTDLTLGVNTSGVTIGYPKWITTYVNDLTSQRAGTNTSVQTTSGTDLSCALNTNGLTIAYPAWLTTAAATNITSARAGTGTSVQTTTGTDLSCALNTNGLTIAYAKWITTYVNDLTSGRAGINGSVATTAGTDLALTLNTSGATIGYPAWITTAAKSSAMASYWANQDKFVDDNSTTIQPTISVLQVVPVVIPYAISASFLRVPVLVAFNSTESAGTTANTTFTFNRTYSSAVGIFTQNVGASSMSLAQLTSTVGTWVIQHIIGAGATGSRYTQTQNITYQVSGTTSQYTTSSAQSSANLAVSTNQLTLFTSARFNDIPFALSLSAGNYWFAFGISSATASSGGLSNFVSNATMNMSMVGVSHSNLSWGAMGLAPANSIQLMPGLGSWSTNAAIMTTASLQIASISSQSSHPLAYFQLARFA